MVGFFYCLFSWGSILKNLTISRTWGYLSRIWKGDKPENLERQKGFDPSTPTLARLCSTPELRPLWRLETGRFQRVRRAISTGFLTRQALFAIFCEGLAYQPQIPHKQ